MIYVHTYKASTVTNTLSSDHNQLYLIEFVELKGYTDVRTSLETLLKGHYAVT